METQTQPRFTDEQVVGFLTLAVQHMGADYVYPNTPQADGPTCSYTRDGKPSCIVGHVLHYAGVTIESLAEFDRSGVTSFHFICERNPDIRDLFSKRAQEWLSAIQKKQDNGHTWGHAVSSILSPEVE